MDNFDEVVLEHAPLAARRLLGSLLIRSLGDRQIVSGKIVETEAYTPDDAASHSFNGETPRTKVMFGPPGFSYVYFTYGLHYCLNVVTGQIGHGAAVLIRAIEPIRGISIMKLNRRSEDIINITNGPAKLCQALKIDKDLNGHDLRFPPLSIELATEIPEKLIITTTRVGISKERGRNWRFYIKDNAWVSKK